MFNKSRSALSNSNSLFPASTAYVSTSFVLLDSFDRSSNDPWLFSIINVTVASPNTQQQLGNLFWSFSNAYRPIHGWLATFVCLFGIASNLLNIIVLTRPNLINSPTNLILTALAFSDLLTMLSSLLNVVYYYLVHDEVPLNVSMPERDTLFWTHFSNIHIMASVTFHSMSIWLTVYLACFRYIYIAFSTPNSIKSLPSRTRTPTTSARTSAQLAKKSNIIYFIQRCLTRCRTYNFTLCGVLSICLFCVIFCFPAYIYPTVKSKAYNATTTVHHSDESINFSSNNSVEQSTIRYTYFVGPGELDERTNGLIFKILFYTQAIFGKFVPCLLLVTFSSLLVHSLVIINRNNKKLNKLGTYSKNNNNYNNNNNNNNTMHKSKNNLAMNNKIKTQIDGNDSSNIIKNQDNNNNNNEKKKGTKNDQYLHIRCVNETNLVNKTPIVTHMSSGIRPRVSLSMATISEKGRGLQRRLSEIRSFGKYFNSNATTTADAATNTAKSPSKPTGGKPKRNKTKENLRTTLMLTIVSVLFVITEFPQSILISMSIIKGESFYNNVYMPLGDLLDILALINNSINFLLYCSMSRAFRNTFYNVMVNIWCCKMYKAYCLSKTSRFGSGMCKQNNNNNNNSNNFSIFNGNTLGRSVSGTLVKNSKVLAVNVINAPPKPASNFNSQEMLPQASNMEMKMCKLEDSYIVAIETNPGISTDVEAAHADEKVAEKTVSEAK